jgi:Raf kinase inhibitor-like YbhB/YbcL family protein
MGLWIIKLKMKLKIVIFSLVVLIFACGKKGNIATNDSYMKGSLNLTSSAFVELDTIPDIYSCNGGKSERFPELKWENGPNNVVSWAIIMDDPEAIPVAGSIWTHWVIYNIPGNISGLGPSTNKTGTIPIGASRGKTSFGDTLYGGPCPPSGQLHHYKFRIFALNKTLNVALGSSAGEIRTAMDGAILDSAVLTGVFGK